MSHDWKASSKRFINTLLGAGKVDRVPYFALIMEQMITRIAGINVRTLYSSPKILADSTIMASEFLNVDTLHIPTAWAGPSEALAFAEANDKKNVIKWFDYLPIFIEQGKICQTVEDIENLKLPDHKEIKLWKTTFAAVKRVREKRKVGHALSLGIWNLVQQLRGVQAFKDMRENPEILLELCEKIYQSQINLYHDWTKEVGPIPSIFYTGYSFNKTMMSFEDAMKFEGQFINRLQKELGVPFILHNCGMKPYFKEICNEIDFIAVNGSHPLDINYWVDFKKKFPKVTIMGATIDVSQELLTGTPLDVEEKVKENILNLAPGGRYMVSPICALPWNVPLPNILAISKAIETYGYYPIA